MDVYNPDVVKVTVKGSVEAISLQNTLYFGLADGQAPWDAVSVAQLAVGVATWWYNHVMQVMCDAYTMDAVVARQMTASGGHEFVYIPPVISPGARTSAILPLNVAIVGSIGTARAGRSYRGRIYVGALTEGDVTGNYLDADVALTLNAALGMALPGVGPIDVGVLGVYSRYENGVKRSVGLFTPAVTFALRDLRVDSQRGRLG